jgi:hypothetical protein
MKNLFQFAAFFLTFSAFAGHPHPKHNMVLFGDMEIFASHIVYKVPHNYQVILKVSLTGAVRSKYLATRLANPGKLMVLLLDPTDISAIESHPNLSGTILIEDEKGDRAEVATEVKISAKDYQILFFDEVPKNLEGIANHGGV